MSLSHGVLFAFKPLGPYPPLDSRWDQCWSTPTWAICSHRLMLELIYSGLYCKNIFSPFIDPHMAPQCFVSHEEKNSSRWHPAIHLGLPSPSFSYHWSFLLVHPVARLDMSSVNPVEYLEWNFCWCSGKQCFWTPFWENEGMRVFYFPVSLYSYWTNFNCLHWTFACVIVSESLKCFQVKVTLHFLWD